MQQDERVFRVQMSGAIVHCFFVTSIPLESNDLCVKKSEVGSLLDRWPFFSFRSIFRGNDLVDGLRTS